MIFYPIQTLVNAGITDILLATAGQSAGDFWAMPGFRLRHTDHTYQEGEGRIAHASRLEENFADGQPIGTVLCDYIIEMNIIAACKEFRSHGRGGHIFLKEVADAERFGVPVFEGEEIVPVEEKPKVPKSCCAVIGIYPGWGSPIERLSAAGWRRKASGPP